MNFSQAIWIVGIVMEIMAAYIVFRYVHEENKYLRTKEICGCSSEDEFSKIENGIMWINGRRADIIPPMVFRHSYYTSYKDGHIEAKHRYFIAFRYIPGPKESQHDAMERIQGIYGEGWVDYVIEWVDADTKQVIKYHVKFAKFFPHEDWISITLYD